MTTTRNLLTALREANAGEDGGVLQQAISAAEPSKSGDSTVRMPTLQKGDYMTASQMLAARFQFAGRWQNAATGQTWLSISDMEAALHSQEIMSQVSLRRQNWPHSIISSAVDSKLSLLGLDVDDGEETYALWTTGREEPRIVKFFGGQEDVYEDFDTFLRALLAA